MNRAITGTNDIPLVCGDSYQSIRPAEQLILQGNKRRFGPAVIEDAPKAEIAQASPSSFPRSSTTHEESESYSPQQAATPGQYSLKTGTLSTNILTDPDAPRKRKSRWGEAKSEPVGLPTAISSSGVSQRELDNYAIQIRLDEINRKLQMNSFIPPERER